MALSKKSSKIGLNEGNINRKIVGTNQENNGDNGDVFFALMNMQKQQKQKQIVVPCNIAKSSQHNYFFSF